MEQLTTIGSIKIVVVGDIGVGKTTLIKRYTNDIFIENSKPTISVDISTKLEVLMDTTAPESIENRGETATNMEDVRETEIMSTVDNETGKATLDNIGVDTKTETSHETEDVQKTEEINAAAKEEIKEIVSKSEKDKENRDKKSDEPLGNVLPVKTTKPAPKTPQKSNVTTNIVIDGCKNVTITPFGTAASGKTNPSVIHSPKGKTNPSVIHSPKGKTNPSVIHSPKGKTNPSVIHSPKGKTNPSEKSIKTKTRGQSSVDYDAIELAPSDTTTKLEKTKEETDSKVAETKEEANTDGQEKVAKEFAKRFKLEEKILSLIPNRVQLKVVFLGDINVGKTSLINRYVKNEFIQSYQPTIGVEFSIKEVPVNGNTVAVVSIFDIAGHERMTSLTKTYFRRSEGAVIVFDQTEKESLDNAIKWKLLLDQNVVNSDGSPIPCLLLGNKWDLLPEEQRSDQSTLSSFAKLNDFIEYFSTSAKCSDDITGAMGHLIFTMLNNRVPTEQGIKIGEANILNDCGKCMC
ncbi:hypothetical protein C0J52_12376 [Blattella germanica]|nr:hypothetical protein C0J52_12376 [Blattella germanica]